MGPMIPNDLHMSRAAYVRSLLAWHGKRQSALAGILGWVFIIRRIEPVDWA